MSYISNRQLNKINGKRGTISIAEYRDLKRRGHKKAKERKEEKRRCTCGSPIKYRSGCGRCGLDVVKGRRGLGKEAVNHFRGIVCCQGCGKRGGVMHIHHIDKDNSNNCIENLEKLCIACHKERHVGDSCYHLIGSFKDKWQ